MNDPRTCSSLCAQARPRDEAALAREFNDARALSAALTALAVRLLAVCKRRLSRPATTAEQILPPA